ncbi:AB hydrolase superfamily protein [Tolypocladium capitatum]|uniref:AB hydrolase superfamily protein n=1 Tax=Tolypocladium capitatum TaxID=45235 RepID=A0A2K3Q737_9HYPO|nr:AB hydrolase superfamily protein [Tolypocladium capitatum]
MNRLNTTSVSLAVTPTVVSTLFSHYLNRKSLKERPTAHLSYDGGLHLIRSFLDFASHHTVEELQAFTSQWVPHPQWVKVDEVTIPAENLTRSAELLARELGPDGIRRVGGRRWWQWRKSKSSLQAEWIEMRSDANQRKKSGDPGKRVMMYIHGGAYFFGSVDEHRYQMQRHARKLEARVFAPKYRLAPQFPFPCGLQDCLAAYLHLLTTQDPSTIVMAGDSAGGGMVVALLCVMRDQGIPLPAGAILISPWVDLTHSFPSVAGDTSFDYIPRSGFHHKPSRAWPPPNDDDVAMLQDEAKRTNTQAGKSLKSSELEEKRQPPVVAKDKASSGEQLGSVRVSTDMDQFLSVMIGGELVTVKDQIQVYTTNALLSHPLVSPVMQPTLGGLPPLLILVGGGEVLRDEQIYLAHKCANPAKYAPPAGMLTDRGRELLQKYKPTDVQLQVWDDLCHVAPTLSFTKPAKYMYRSISQFGAWALARAQKTGIEIMDDDDISIITSSSLDTEVADEDRKQDEETKRGRQTAPGQIGKAGDPLPPFKKHMIRQRVTRHGVTLPLVQESELPGCSMEPTAVGVIKEGPIKKWMAAKRQWDSRYSAEKAKVHKKIVKDMARGLQDLGPGERPPPSALAGRRPIGSDLAERRAKSMGLALWSLWGSKHDEATVEREQKADQQPEVQAVTGDEGRGARSFGDIEAQQPSSAVADGTSRNRSRRRTVVDENQTGTDPVNENTPVAMLLDIRREKEASGAGMLSSNYVPETGVAGKRPFIDGIALPFTLKKDAKTASMVTLNSAVTPGTSSRSMSPAGSRMDASGRPDPEDASKAEQMLASRTARPDLESLMAAETVPQVENEKEKGGAAGAS